MKFKNPLGKFILATLIFSLVFGSLSLISPKKVSAGGAPVFDAILTAVTQGGFSMQNIFFNVSEEARKALRDAVVYAVLNVVADDVINWVQGGGQPKFVDNWENYSNDAYKKGSNEAVEEIPASYICPEFRDQVQKDLGVRFSDNPKSSADNSIEELKCTLDQGGLSTAPQNNKDSVETLIKNKMAAKGTSKAQAAQNDAIAGKGFTSSIKCIASDDKGRCLKEAITTPAGTVADVVSRTLTSNLEFLSNVQSPFSALVNALISRLMNQGLSNLTPSSTGGGESYSSQNTSYAGQVGQELENQKKTMVEEYQKFLDEKQSVLNTKKESLGVAFGIASSTCPAAANVQGKITSLNSDVSNLESTVNQLNNLISEIQNVTSENYSQQMPIAQQHFQDFIAAYGNQLYQDIYTGDARETAQSELQQLKTTQQQCAAYTQG